MRKHDGKTHIGKEYNVMLVLGKEYNDAETCGRSMYEDT
jgi:hypothetical protein